MEQNSDNIEKLEYAPIPGSVIQHLQEFAKFNNLGMCILSINDFHVICMSPATLGPEDAAVIAAQMLLETVTSGYASRANELAANTEVNDNTPKRKM